MYFFVWMFFFYIYFWLIVVFFFFYFLNSEIRIFFCLIMPYLVSNNELIIYLNIIIKFLICTCIFYELLGGKVNALNIYHCLGTDYSLCL